MKISSKGHISNNTPKGYLTTECWNSPDTVSFMVITAHFTNENFELIPVFQQCNKMKEQHTTQNLAHKLRQDACEWQTGDKTILTVSENAPNLSIVQQLSKWKHFGCFIHSIHLIVKGGLQNVHEQKLLNNIGRKVFQFKGSCTTNEKMMKYQQNNTRRQSLKLVHHVQPHCSSTFSTLERFVLLEVSVMTTVALKNQLTTRS